MDPQRSDSPPEGPKKERWADLMHVAYVEELANFGDFGDFTHLVDVLNIASPAEAEESELRTQNSELHACRILNSGSVEIPHAN